MRQGDTLTPEAKELIRKYITKIVIPAGTIFSVISAILGFTISNIISSNSTNRVLTEALPKIIEVTQSAADSKKEADDLLVKVQRMASQIEMDSKELSALLETDNIEIALAKKLLESEGLKRKLSEGLDKSLTSRIDQVERKIELSDKWFTIPENFSRNFDPNMEYRVKVLNPANKDHRYNEGYIYLTTIIDHVLWGAWTSGTSTRGFIEISNVSGNLLITDGLFEGNARKSFILESNKPLKK